MVIDDLYSILGVLPTAEPIVITAAYRALAQRYHPDRWKGSPEEAHNRMSEINRAYSVLSDAEKRKQYDKNRESQNGVASNFQSTNDPIFEAALLEVEEKWQIACSVFEDLPKLRDQLQKISASLAFAFVTLLLESKLFSKRQDLASRLEKDFLRQFFGTNEQIIFCARRLIFSGNRDAALALNRLVNVLGPEIDANLIIDKIAEQFQLHSICKNQEAEERRSVRIKELIRLTSATSEFEYARGLAETVGYTVREISKGLFSFSEIEVIDKKGESKKFHNKYDFINWVKLNFCNDPKI
jgi:DnaJ-domain-containing protein 1